ncbi:hypothetical protein F5J12DRAFT_779712 [Pisolithus orientalis]|uniref:uncharacterized protein n=1 Tax=Pisolithus orientalis TaxID=936130 RepID=UPI002224E201|nr:uncharacterized protein F5J12DRAFT_779712 [Pisolithus orientalis]KAI6030607.1 hypothetical protein F5J12DRAFT_779712 [Pisolithus orientalis]
MSTPTTPPHPLLMQPTLCTLPACLITAHKNCLETGFYLGNKSVQKNIHWVWDGHANCLAIKPTGSGDDGSSKYATPPPEGTVDIAPLCAIVQISASDFWLTADAGYHKNSKIWKSLADVKASCATEQPDIPPVQDYSKTALENVTYFQNAIATPGYGESKGFLLHGGKHFKVCHTLFEPCSANSESDNSYSETVADDPEGALVELYFALSHWAIAKKKGSIAANVYGGEIIMIQVLAPPHSTVAGTPRKQKLSLFIDPSTSPNKKFHQN